MTAAQTKPRPFSEPQPSDMPLSSSPSRLKKTLAGCRRCWPAALIYAVMTAIVLYPILMVRVPGLCDYPNHLARMHILSNITQSEALGRFYRLRWQPIPYLAMDAAFVVLNHVATIYNAGRIFVGICIMLPVLSVAALHFAIHRRFSLVPLVTFLFCYNYLLSWGFLNYLPALCLAVLLFAGWIGSAGWPRWPRAALFCVLAMLLYLSHLVAFGAYCLAVGCYELAAAWRAGCRPWHMIAVDWLAAGLQAVPAIMLALSVHAERPFVGQALTSYGDPATKVIAVLSPVLFLGNGLDLLAAELAVLVLILGLATRRLRVASTLWPVILAVGILAVATPHWLFGTFGMDIRLPLLVVMLLIGAISTTERMGRGLGCAVLAAFLALTAVRTAKIATELQVIDRQITQVRDVVSALPRGMRLLLVDTTTFGPNLSAMPALATLHVGMVAVIDRDAFVPNLFTGLTTVAPTPAYRAASTPNGRPLHLSDLTDGLGRTDDPGNDKGDSWGGRVYWMGWEKKFDYVLIRHFGDRPATLPANLRLVATSSVVDLYRIDNTISP